MSAPRTDSPDSLLTAAWAALGGEPELLSAISVTGRRDGLLPSCLAAAPAMLAAVGASTLAASVLDAVRRGLSPAPAVIDAEHVALAARSESYARQNGSDPADLFAPLSRFWPTADGWLRLHANYAWHRERALRVLDCDGTPEAVGEAVSAWRGDELEEALTAAGALGYVVRTAPAWREHPQGRAVAALPLLQHSLGRGSGRALGPGRGAAGVRVLDLTRVIAGPVATRTLAAWGADVLRIDSPNLPEIPGQALDMLPGKRSTLLDFSLPEDRAMLEDLLAHADVVVQGYRPGALDRYGLSAGALAERHPHLSVVTLSAWSDEGPWANRRGFDSLVQCSTGIAEAEGTNARPGALPAQVLDHATGYLAAAAVLLALAGIQRDEPPRSVRLSLAQTARWLLDAGPREPDPPRELNPDAFTVTLPGASHPVGVITPPGQAGDLVPAWTSMTDFGSDPARFQLSA